MCLSPNMSRPFGLKKTLWSCHQHTHIHTQSMWGGRVYWKRAGATWPYLWSRLQLQLQLQRQLQLLWPPAAAWCAHFSINCLVGCMQAVSALPQHTDTNSNRNSSNNNTKLSCSSQWFINGACSSVFPPLTPLASLGVAARCCASCCYQSANKLSCIGTALESPHLPELALCCLPSVEGCLSVFWLTGRQHLWLRSAEENNCIYLIFANIVRAFCLGINIVYRKMIDMLDLLQKYFAQFI